MLLRTVLLREVGEILAEQEFVELTCSPSVEKQRDGTVTISLTVGPIGLTAELVLLELVNRLRYLEGLGQVRAFAEAYGIDAHAIERLLPGQGEETK